MQVIFAVSDLSRSLAFYERAFGWPRNKRIDFAEYVELKPPDGGTLGLFERESYAQLLGAPPMAAANGEIAPAYLYVRVPDVRATIAELEAAGGRPLSRLALRSWGEEAAWFADPDGNVVAVAQAEDVSHGA
jgi:catechol 2,3-dioxygenase-like lactoylglutathione lyase family enzyme